MIILIIVVQRVSHKHGPGLKNVVLRDSLGVGARDAILHRECATNKFQQREVAVYVAHGTWYIVICGSLQAAWR